MAGLSSNNVFLPGRQADAPAGDVVIPAGEMPDSGGRFPNHPGYDPVTPGFCTGDGTDGQGARGQPGREFCR